MNSTFMWRNTAYSHLHRRPLDSLGISQSIQQAYYSSFNVRTVQGHHLSGVIQRHIGRDDSMRRLGTSKFWGYSASLESSSFPVSFLIGGGRISNIMLCHSYTFECIVFLCLLHFLLHLHESCAGLQEGEQCVLPKPSGR